MDDRLIVTATARGYYGGRIREAGEQFTIDQEAHLGSWMQVKKETAKAETSASSFTDERIAELRAKGLAAAVDGKPRNAPPAYKSKPEEIYWFEGWDSRAGPTS